MRADLERASGSTMAIQRIKQSILAKSCKCTGYSTLVGNLVCSHSPSSLHNNSDLRQLPHQHIFNFADDLQKYEMANKQSWAPWEHEYWQVGTLNPT